MNRRIRKELKVIRDTLDTIDGVLIEMFPLGEGHWAEDEGKELAEELTPSTELNWTAADEEPTGLNLAQIKELPLVKDVIPVKDFTIEGTIKIALDMKAYIDKKTQEAGIIYRFVLEDASDEITAITFNDMAEEFKQYMIGTRLKITNAWMIKENKHGVKELHVGNFAKVEVVE